MERQRLEVRASISQPLRYWAMLNDVFGSNTFNVLPHVVALLVAYALAIPIGWNREQEERSAGLRTFPLVAVATCGFIHSPTVFPCPSPPVGAPRSARSRVCSRSRTA